MMADARFIERWLLPPLRVLETYHRFELRGAEHVPATGPLLVVATHSALTYDILLGMAGVYRHTGRLVHPLGDRIWFRIPLVRSFMTNIGVVVAGPERARELLRRGEIVGVAPGGMWEALRPREQRFQVRWEGRRGFARLAVETEVPIVLAACPAADLAVTMYGSDLTDEAYRRYKVPVPFMRGIGPTLVPRPVKLVARLSEPIAFERGRSVDELVSLVKERMQRLIDDAVREEGLA